jgi:plasmid stabilization system protein ParE
MAEITWAPSSLKDIKSIAEYIANDSVQAASSIVALFLKRQKS